MSSQRPSSATAPHLRHGRARERLRRAADGSRIAERRRRPAAQVPRRRRTTRPTCTRRSNIELQQAAARPAWRPARRGRGDRTDDRPHPGARQQPDVRPERSRRSEDRAASYVTSLQARDDSPLLNRATQGLYVPGSVFKIVTATAGARIGRDHATDNVRGPTRRVSDRLPGRRLPHPRLPAQRCSDRPSRSTSTRRRRCPATSGSRTPDSISGRAEHARLGGALRLWPAHSVRARHVAQPGHWRRRTARRLSDRVELANAAYGQAEVLVTPLQMALVASTIANHGLEMKPKLVDYLETADGTQTRHRSAGAGAGLRRRARQRSIGQAMQLAVEGEYGELFAGAAKVPGVPTAGKSGTAAARRRRGTAQLVHRLCARRCTENRHRGHRRGRRRRGTAGRTYGRRVDGRATLAPLRED